ncbi:MAG: sulfurtransferase-like selenium metabolism protein YedF [Actinomycetota bacterium]|nr:sulfurtransferase-like selenium metabolism protein YedF [Actinomycetota bacterium]
MSKIVDARGLPCPQPVILAKKALEGEAEVEVLVDNEAARDNVSRLGRKMGCDIKVSTEGGDFRVVLSKSEVAEEIKALAGKSSVVFISSTTIGKSSDELGEALLKTFLNTLTQSEIQPDKIILMNEGVQLVVRGSPMLDTLENLSKKGVEILACGTCLDYFKLKDKVAVGEISNMFDILSSFMEADKVITV